MAGRFPIEYSKVVPSGEVAQVPISAPMLNVRTGAVEAAESYAQSGAALSRLGQDLFGMAVKIQDQKDSLELSRRKRQIDEMGNAAYNAVKGDLEVDAKTWDKFEQDVTALYAEGGRIGVAVEKYANQVLPEWQDTFDKHSIGTARKNVHDEYEFEGEKLLTQGNLVEYYTLLNNRLLLEDITQAEYDSRIERASNDSIIQQMRVAIGENRPQDAFVLAEQFDEKTAKPDQLDARRKYLTMAKQVAQANTDTVQNEITFDMFNNRDKMLSERTELGQQYITRLQSTSGLSAESARVMTNRIEKWMSGAERPHNAITYSQLYRKVTRLHRGIGQADTLRKEIVANFETLDDEHFESLNKYLEQTVEEWNADTLRRLEKEATPHLAPRLSMLERFMAMSETPGISAAEKAKYDSFIERLQEPAKIDASRLALYNERCRNWISKNPDSPDLYQNGKRILAEFERYDDAQIRQMERQLENYVPPLTVETKEPSPFVDYPDAYKEGDNWYVMRNGKRYRIEP